MFNFKNMVTVVMLILFAGINASANALDFTTKALVNGAPISAYDVEQLSKFNKNFMPKYKNKSIKEMEKTSLEMLIGSRVKYEAIEKYKIKISQEDLQKSIDRIESQNNLKKGSFYKELSKKGINKNIIIEFITIDFMWMRYVQQFYGEAISVEKFEVDKKYNEVISSVKNYGRIVDLVQIIYESQKDYKKMKKDISCKEFEVFARKHGKIGSGNLGTVKVRELNKSVFDVVSELPVGKVSPPLHIQGDDISFFVCKDSFEETEASKTIPKDLKSRLRFQLLNDKMESISTKYYEKEKANTIIEMY